MVSKLASFFLICLALASLGVALWWAAMPLTISVGSGPVALKQNGVMVTMLIGSVAATVTPTLPVASTAGTALVALVAGNIPGISYIAPSGWIQLATANDGARFMDAWLYLNNPGNIQAVNFASPSLPSGPWFAQLSEWSNVAYATATDSSGTATATIGTTLTPATTSALIGSGDVAITAWRQTIAAPGAVTFTSPSGWTRLSDNGSDATQSAHLDGEYLLSPIAGAILAPTLTSNTATNTLAAGVVFALKAATPAVDMTAYLAAD